jgi:hypothetical protein
LGVWRGSVATRAEYGGSSPTAQNDKFLGMTSEMQKQIPPLRCGMTNKLRCGMTNKLRCGMTNKRVGWGAGSR